MSWRTSKFAIFARNVGRRMGVNRFIAHSTLLSGMENDPDAELLRSICEGDCVWDIGANLGTYTIAFADKVGPSGHVIAFEPSCENRQRLAAAATGRANITIRAEALGAEAGIVRFVQRGGPTGSTSHIDYGATGEDSYTVNLVRVDALLAEMGLPAPNVIKIDVEGAERDVIEGMGDILADARLRTLSIEVHFSILQQRGRQGDARAIEVALREQRFAVRWSDASHILATRKAIGV